MVYYIRQKFYFNSILKRRPTPQSDRPPFAKKKLTINAEKGFGVKRKKNVDEKGAGYAADHNGKAYGAEKS